MIEKLGEIAGPDAVAGVGQHQMWAAQFSSEAKSRGAVG